MSLTYSRTAGTLALVASLAACGGYDNNSDYGTNPQPRSGKQEWLEALVNRLS